VVIVQNRRVSILNMDRISSQVSLGTSRKDHKKKVNRGRWTAEEDSRLKDLASEYGNDWKAICAFFPDRSEMQCATRWTKVLSPTLIKGQWTKDEDDRVVQLVKLYGAKRWTLIAKNLPGRIGKQCRERFVSRSSTVE